MTTSNEHNNAPAVPQGWVKASDRVPLESDGEVFIRFTDGSIGTGWATYWHGASNDFARWTFPDPDEFRLVSEWAKNVPASTGMHWTENEPVRLPHARTGRVYLAGPMTGISELNFPAFNQEAERLRAEGLQVLNPADHGIVDGADWADYLRHDIAGLASCERIHLLRGWTKSKGACLEMTIAKALGMTVTYQVDAEMEHNNAPAQGEPFGHFRAEPFGWTDCAKDDEGAIALYERPQEVGLTNHQFDLICQAIDKADTVTMECDYMLDSDDCIAVVRVMQVLFDVAAPGPAHDAAPVAYRETITGRLCDPQDDHRLRHPLCYRPLVFGDTLSPAPAQEVGLTDEDRADMACAVAAICTGTSSRTVAATAIEWTERALRAKGQT